MSLGDPLTPEQIEALRAFETEMRENVIPEIERVMRQRALDAQRSRHWLI
jgi:hypothetical protein